MSKALRNGRSRLKRFYRKLREYSVGRLDDLYRTLIVLRRRSLVRTTFIAVTGSAGKSTATKMAYTLGALPTRFWPTWLSRPSKQITSDPPFWTNCAPQSESPTASVTPLS